MRTADPPDNAFADKLAEWSDRFLHHPITPRLDARLIDALTGHELAAVPAGGASAVFAPDGRTFVQDVELSIFPQRQTGFPFELWDLPPRQPIALLIGGAAAWTVLFLGAIFVMGRFRERRARRRGANNSAVEPAMSG